MTLAPFIANWCPGGPAYALDEEQGAQSHFLDLCDLLGVPKPGSDQAEAEYLPAMLTIDEEGSYQRLEVHRYTGRYAHLSDIEFRVTALDWDGVELPDTPCRMRLRTTRAQLLREFARRLAAWLEHDYVPDDWYHLEQDEFETWTEFAQALQRVDLRQRLDMAGLLQRLPQTGAV